MSRKKKVDCLMQQIADSTRSMGDELNKQWKETKDLKVGQTSLNAYQTAIKANQVMLIHKKLTGEPAKLKDFI